MDTAIIITGFIGFGTGLLIGAIIWGAINKDLRIKKNLADAVVGMQAEEIDALNKNNLRLRGQCTELATQAHNEQENVKLARRQTDSMVHFYNQSAAEYSAEKAAHATTKRKLSAAKGQITKLKRRIGDAKHLNPEDVQWIVNDIAELGVLINGQAFFLYKGTSLIYDPRDSEDSEGDIMMYRPVFKREFGECCHPINYSDPTKIGTVSLADSDDWKPLPDNQTTQGDGG